MGKITNNELANNYKARVICTSTTRPSNPVSGLEIYETDTGNIYTWNGSAWEDKLAAHLAENATSTQLGHVQTEVNPASGNPITVIENPLANALQTIAGPLAASYFAASGLTGATAASRYVGATASGAPTSGTFAKGDFVIDQTGQVWLCTVAGTPGTWIVPLRVAVGNYADTSTVVGANATYTKTIPLGFNAVKGSLAIRGLQGSTYYWAEARFSTIANDAISFASQLVNLANPSYIFNGLGTDSFLIAPYPTTAGFISSNGNIGLQSAVIIGSNLVLTFKNTQASDDTFKIYRLYWEVEG